MPIHKEIFPYRVKQGAYDIMQKILRFPKATGHEIDGSVCRVTVTNHDLRLSLRPEYREEYKDDRLLQIRLQNNNERDFVVMSSLLERQD